MFEIYTFFENTTEIYTFFENRTEIYTFFENRFEIYTCILFENRTEISNILSMVDGLTIGIFVFFVKKKTEHAKTHETNTPFHINSLTRKESSIGIIIVLIVTPSTIDKMFEISVLFSNKICNFFENRTKIYIFCRK